MKQRVGSVGVAVAARNWTQRFAFVLLILLSFGIMLVGKADTVVVSRARTLLIDLIAPVMDAASRPIASAKEAATTVQELIALKQENARLVEENQTLLEWQTIGRELQSQNAALRDLLKFTPDPRASYVTAPVIADTSSSYVRSLIVLAGENDGVVKGQAAITGAGLVGRVLEVGGQRSERELSIAANRIYALERPRSLRASQIPADIKLSTVVAASLALAIGREAASITGAMRSISNVRARETTTVSALPTSMIPKESMTRRTKANL